LSVYLGENRLFSLSPLGFSLLAACHSDSKTNQSATTEPAVPALADSPGAYYRQYRGLLPGASDSITLNLLAAPRQSNDT
jgi:hypothetical protein